MTIIHVHVGKGCEYIVKEEGNELSDVHVHQYLCDKAADRRLVFKSGSEMKVCVDHAKKMKRGPGKNALLDDELIE